MLHDALVFCTSFSCACSWNYNNSYSNAVCFAKLLIRTLLQLQELTYSAFAAAAAAFFAFLFSRRGFVRSSFSSASSSDFSDLTSSGLYHTGGLVISAGPPGSSAIVKWNAATYVFTGV